MRKITFFFAMLLMCFSAARVSAQSLEDYGMVPLITDAGMFESPFGDSAEGLDIGALCDNDPETFWHTDWHGEVEGDFHWLQINFTEPISGDFVLYMLRRSQADNDHPTAITIEGSNDGEAWAEISQVHFGFAGKGTAEISPTWKIAEPVSKLRLTVTDCMPAEPGFRKFWHAAEIQIYAAGGQGLILYTLNNVLLKYDGYLPGGGSSFDLGNMPGQYANVEAWEAFQKDLIYVNSYMGGEIEEELTLEEAEALVARIEENYQAILDSKVPLDPQEDGYYFVATGLQYYVQTPKLDENGDTIFDEFDEVVYETTYPTKAMYANGGTLSWKTLDETDCNFLFRLDYNAETNGYKFYNCATNGRVNTVAKSDNVQLIDSLDATASEIAITLSSKDAETGREIIFLSRVDQNSGFAYLHQGGHSEGAGVSGNVVGWETTAASGWCLIPVADADAEAMIEAWAPIRDRKLMLENVASMKAEGNAALKIARDVKTTIDFEQPLISEVSQFSSPSTESSEGSIDALIDGDAATFWHSAWSGGAVALGTHYLQVELTDPEAVQSAAIKMTRRNVTNDHITEWGVYGTNENDAEAEEKIGKDACTFLGEISTPYASADETVTSDAFDTKGFKYIRFYINNTECPGIESRGYGHMAEFQLYPAVNTESATSQKNMLGDLYTNLEAAIAAVPTTEDDITVDHYTALKAAYDAFMAKYVNPAPLRTAMANAEKNANTMVVGTLPGYWSEGANGDLTAAIATAAAYDNGGVYEAAKSEELIAQLNTESTNFFGKANKVSTDKWYYIHMGTEELYEEKGWDKSTLTEEATGLGNLFSQYVTTGVWQDVQLTDTVISEYSGLDGEEVREGTALYFTNDNGHDGSMFRFIAVGDTAYVIQNKATGLYIHCAGANNNNVTLGLTPTTFKPTAVGYGQLIFPGTSLAGVGTTNLHAQMADHKLVTWETNTYGSRSSMFVEEAEDVDFAALNNTFIRNVRPGQIYAQCYPVSVETEEEGMYTVAGTYTEGEKNYVALNAITKAEAGKPFIYIAAGDWAVPAEGEEPLTEAVEFTGGNEVVAEADSINGLVGTFVTRAVEKGTTIFADNMAKATTTTSTNVAANGAFLRFGWTEVEAGGDYSLVIEIDGEVTVTAIENVLNKVAKTGNVYDLNGRLVRTNATLNDVKALGRGMYILNGAKIMVK